MLWIILAFCVSFLKALSEVFGKKFISWNHKNWSLDEYTLALWIRTIVIIPIGMVSLIVWVKIPGTSFLWFILLTSLLSATHTITFLKSLKASDISLIWPLWTLTIPFVLSFWIIFLWEIPNLYGALWVMFVFLWSYFLWVTWWKQDFLDPIKKLSQDTWARYMLLTCILMSVTAIFDKIWVSELWAVNWLLYINTWTVFWLLVIFYFFGIKIQLSKTYSIKNIKKIFSLAFVMWLWNILQLIAIQYLFVTYVIAIKRSSWIFSILLWAVFLQEKNIFPKLIAVSIMTLWVIVITFLGI